MAKNLVKLFSRIFILHVCFSFNYGVNCWESYELDLFDLVEEVNQNFYEFLGVSQNSDSNEIKKAYRKLSLQLHPDRNSDHDAETKFRFLASIYDVLKDDVKRARYDQVLEFGLPDWRSPVYYFRRVRKLTLYELTNILVIIVSIGHYFVLWAQHFEKKLTLDDRIMDMRKIIEKKQKKKKPSPELDEVYAQLQDMYENLPSPKLLDTLPVRFVLFLFYFSKNLLSSAKEMLRSKEKIVEEQEENEPVLNLKQKSNKSKEHLDLNPKKIEKSDIKPVVQSANNLKRDEKVAFTKQFNEKKEWLDREKSDLIKAISKYPAGTSDRWVKISELVGRPASECIQMEKLMKTDIKSFSNLNLNTTIKHKDEIQINEQPTSSESRIFESGLSVDQWSQEQQTSLEKALKEFNKDIPNRWEKIADKVLGKNKEECINRYKSLCAAVKKK